MMMIAIITRRRMEAVRQTEPSNVVQVHEGSTYDFCLFPTHTMTTCPSQVSEIQSPRLHGRVASLIMCSPKLKPDIRTFQSRFYEHGGCLLKQDTLTV